MLAFQVTVLQGLASLAITPAAARLWATGAHDRVRRLLSATATLATTATLAVVAALAAVGGPLLGLAYGPDFVSGLPLLLILAAGGVGQAAFGFSVPYLLVSRMIKRAVVSCGLALVVAVPLCVVGAAMSAILLPVAQTVAAGGVPLPSWNVAEAVRVLRRSGEVPAS
jgi:O-antigen/teichoic acid export membrane protein